MSDGAPKPRRRSGGIYIHVGLDRHAHVVTAPRKPKSSDPKSSPVVADGFDLEMK